MKMIHIHGDDDYSALTFMERNDGKTVEQFLAENAGMERIEDDEFYVDVYEFTNIDSAFLKFVRENIEDYDMSKHQTFLFENEVIKR